MFDLCGHSTHSSCSLCNKEPEPLLYLAARDFGDGVVSTKIGISRAPCIRVGSLTPSRCDLPVAKLIHVERVDANFRTSQELREVSTMRIAIEWEQIERGAYRKNRGAGCMERHLCAIFAGRASAAERRGAIAPSEWFDIDPEDALGKLKEAIWTWMQEPLPPVPTEQDRWDALVYEPGPQRLIGECLMTYLMRTIKDPFEVGREWQSYQDARGRIHIDELPREAIEIMLEGK
jgi:hypothetical protein